MMQCMCVYTQVHKTAALVCSGKTSGSSCTAHLSRSLPAALELHSGRNLHLSSPAIVPQLTKETVAISLAISQFFRHAERLLLWVTPMDFIACIATQSPHCQKLKLNAYLSWNGRVHLTARDIVFFPRCRVLTLARKIETRCFRHLGFFPSIIAAFFSSFSNRIHGCHSEIIIQQFIRHINHLLPLRCRHETHSPLVSFTSHLMCLILENLQ